MSETKKVTVNTLKKMKQTGEKIAMLTAYDAAFAHLFDEAGIDVLLVGDSVGMAVQGAETTLGVTMDQMVYHCAAVSRGAKRAQVVGDLPFMAYQASIEDAVRNAGRLVSEGGAEAVKLEGGAEFRETIQRIVRAGIPVVGHIGLTPQSFHRLGGYVVQGRDEEKARKLIADAVALEEAGVSVLVLEMIPAELAKTITERLAIPTIGIGAGPHTDGQVLVCYDALGMNPDFSPKFLKRFADLHKVVTDAAAGYLREVKGGLFPTDELSFHAPAPKHLAAVPDLPEVTEAEDDDASRGPVYGVPL